MIESYILFHGFAMRCLICLTALLLLIAPGRADYSDGVAAYERGDYEAAVEEWQPLADDGLAKAQYNLGVMYATGRGVTQSFDQARSWFLRAAEQGLGPAATALATMYENGDGVEPDLVQSYRWLEIAAALGDEKALMAKPAVSMKMTAAEVDQAERMAQGWLQSSTPGQEPSKTSNDALVTLQQTGRCSGCDLQDEDLSGIDLRGADLSDANLAGAYLFLSDLTDADLEGSNLTNANLYGVKLCKTTMPDGSVENSGC